MTSRISSCTALTALSISALLFACPQNKPETATQPAAQKAPATTQPATTPPTDKPAAAATTGTGQMANCPSTVEGASTAVQDAADSVVVTVTAGAEAATTEIRTRAKHLAEVSVKNPTEIKHDKEGSGGGGLGNCPVVLADTTISSEDVPGGAKITVKPAKAEDLEKLKAATKERHAKMTANAAPAK